MKKSKLTLKVMLGMLMVSVLSVSVFAQQDESKKAKNSTKPVKKQEAVKKDDNAANSNAKKVEINETNSIIEFKKSTVQTVPIEEKSNK